MPATSTPRTTRVFYVGKWFFYRPRLRPSEGTPIPFLPGIAGVRKKYLEPERARTYVDLGKSLRPQGKLDEAIDAFEQAIFHFQDDPRTTADQVVAWLELGHTQEQAGDELAARRAFQRVAELDAGQASTLGGGARLLAPEAPLGNLAAVTAGALVQGPQDLESALDDLRHRLRVTFELSGEPSGSLIPLAISHRGGLRIVAPTWARSATPPEIAAHRIRRLLASPLLGEGAGAELDIRLDIRPGTIGRKLIEVGIDEGDLDSGAHYLRPTLAVARALDGEIVGLPLIFHGPVAIHDAAAESPWQFTHEVGTLSASDQVDGAEQLIAIVVDELDTGRWGLDIVSID